MQNYYIEGNNRYKVSLDKIVRTSTSGTNGYVNIPNYNLTFRYVNNRDHKLDCCRASGKYYSMINGVKRDIFDNWNIPAKSIDKTNGGSATLDFINDDNYKGIKYVRVSLHGGGGGGGRGSSRPAFGGGGGGGAFVLSGLISTNNMKSVQIYSAKSFYAQNGSGGQSSWFKAVYNDDTTAQLTAPGGEKGGQSYAYSNGSGGSGGIFSASSHNSANFPIVQTLNGTSGNPGKDLLTPWYLYPNQSVSGGVSGWQTNLTYSDLIGASKGSNGANGTANAGAWVNPTSGAATIYLYM